MKADFNIEEVALSMLSALQGELKKDWPAAKATMEDFIRRQQRILEIEALYRINGQLDEENYKSRLEDKKRLMEAQLEAVKAVSKAMAQKAANAAIEVLENAVLLALKGLI
jgi:poly(A) polymerase Pap1